MLGVLLLMPHIKRERRRIQHRRKVSDYELWNWSHVEDYNIFHYNDAIVLSLGNIASTFHEKREYEVNGTRYWTF